MTLSPRALIDRMTPTLALCLLGAGIAAVGLFLPAISPLPSDDSQYAVPTADAASDSPYNADGPSEAPADAAADPEPAPATPAAPAIDIVNFAFAGDLTVAAGAVVEVTNVDGAPHTVTADDGSFDTGTLGGGAAGSFVAPSAAGTYSFICTIHPSMTGQLTVVS
ncbi:MAG: cupredoxin domain-containing protein [Ilumatobacter sp.]